MFFFIYHNVYYSIVQVFVSYFVHLIYHKFRWLYNIIIFWLFLKQKQIALAVVLVLQSAFIES